LLETEADKVYLRQLEMVGFKSFAEKTKLAFEPGMTAIVGPNGCGKSNVSDALRWVLGEQSAKALRGAKMEDCIFNGTLNRKPLGMAEVSITFAECEGVLNTEYHEVTITRRVFRSGEGQYFINRTPCRLKDIQRLLMDTGIGTSSYSFMAQGRIDQILSARPEDRRAIFEEASGITKYKTDKREALRKLDYTEANLLRLADVIREVRRQIGSLQRQAGKARRYKTLKEELRGLDIFATKRRLTALNTRIQTTECDLADIAAALETVHTDVQECEARNAALHENMLDAERQIAHAAEEAMQAQGKLDRSQDMMRMNRQRIEEYREWAARDTREVDTLHRQLADQKDIAAGLTAEVEKGRAQRDALAATLRLAQQKYDAHRGEMDTARSRIQSLRDESVKLEALTARLQNQLVELENRERSNIVQRERMTAEKSQLARVVAGYSDRTATLAVELETLRETSAGAATRLERMEQELRDTRTQLRDLQQQRNKLHTAAARAEAQVDMLTDADDVQGDFPKGTQLLLDEGNPLQVDRAAILGTLATLIEAPPDHAIALEAALRAMLDALVVSTPDAARAMLGAVAARHAGPARLLAAESAPAPAPVTCSGTRLLDVCVCSPAAQPALARLLANVFVVPDVAAIPRVVPTGATVIAQDGTLIRGDGFCEFWMATPGESNPLARKHAIRTLQRELDALRRDVAARETESGALADTTENLEREIATARRALDEARRALAQKEGEQQLVVRESELAAKRHATVAWELDELTGKSQSWDTERLSITTQQDATRQQRERVAGAIDTQTRELNALETRVAELQADVTEARIASANVAQRVEHQEHQLAAATGRIEQLSSALEGRHAGLQSYESNIAKLITDNDAAAGAIEELEATVRRHTAQAAERRVARDSLAATLKQQEQSLAAKRADLEAKLGRKSDLEVLATELRMRRQTTVERVTGDYNLAIEQVMDEHDPDFDDEAPTLETVETRVAELRAKLEAMGPVNLVAIEEYKEHEERYTFLTTQEEDLIQAKQQLTELIRKINHTTSDLFRETFARANANFENMFTRLFNGGTAKLVLVDEDDILECGIEIIARPPGKRLQNITLLSGGERTLTAVALLFAIYMIKPSPFCLLDELDAPLDDSNIDRFIAVLQEFIRQSQFVVITHSRQTIAAADILYGVTMPERGVSRIMSMKFRDGRGGVLTANETDTAEEDAPALPPPSPASLAAPAPAHAADEAAEDAADDDDPLSPNAIIIPEIEALDPPPAHGNGDDEDDVFEDDNDDADDEADDDADDEEDDDEEDDDDDDDEDDS
jgi:chromosome segregation protein